MTKTKGFTLASGIAGFMAITILTSPAQALDAVPEGASADRYLSAIELIESNEGAYSSNLTQNLFGLGTAQQEQGEHNEAIETFKRAMHVSRINDGLYNLDQVPILEELIESYIADENWEDANDRHQYLFWLHRRNFGEADSRLLPVIEKLSSWHLSIYTLNLSAGLHQHLVNAHALFKLAVKIIDTNYGQDDLRLVKSLQGLTVTNYFLRRYQAETAQKLSEATRGGKAPTAQERAQLDQYTINSYASGKRAITRIVNVLDKHQESMPSAAAKARVNLGDWYLLFNKWKSAQTTYQLAYDDLIQSEADPAIVNALFGRPVALPDLPMLVAEAKKPEDDTPYVLVSFDVSPFGKAKNISILDSFPKERTRLRAKVRKSLKLAKFRPRFEDGEPVLTEKVTHRYIFPDEKRAKKPSSEQELASTP